MLPCRKSGHIESSQVVLEDLRQLVGRCAAEPAIGGEPEIGQVPVRGIKRALRSSERNDLDDQLTWEAEQQALCYETEDMHEGLAAAREKRSPAFKGR